MKEVNFAEEARSELKKGLDILADAVKSTLGPKGRNVVIQNASGKPSVTKDGVTVAKHIELLDPMQDLGAKIVKQASQKTADKAGDGTTTSVVLAQAMVDKGSKFIANGSSPIDIKRGMESALKVVTDSIAKQAKPVKDDWLAIKNIATISSNNDTEIGNIIADALEKVTMDGVISVEDSNSNETYTEQVQGLDYPQGYTSRYFITDLENMVTTLDNPYILVTSDKITSSQEINMLLEQIAQEGRSILIISKEVEAQPLQMIIYNRIQGKLKVAVTKCPWYGKYQKLFLEDIAILTGATLIQKESGLSVGTATLEHLGEAEKVTISYDSTTIISGKGDPEKIKEREKQLMGQLRNTKDDHYDSEKLRERIAKIKGGVGVLYVGARTPVELQEKKDRIDDALSATKAAIKEGIVPGAGQVFLNALAELQNTLVPSEYADGFEVVRHALISPLKTICENAGKEPATVIYDIQNNQNPKMGEANTIGYDANKDQITDLIESGIIDPAMVSRLAIENAVSVASTILMCEATVTFDQKPDLGFPQQMG